MVHVSHDWDDTDYVAMLSAALTEYLRACYDGQSISVTQLSEISQAFLSGIHWLNTRDDWCPDDLTKALRELLRTKATGS